MCVLMIGICGIAAFALDIGMIYTERSKLHNAIDAAALAAILELPSNEGKAISLAKGYLDKNGIDPIDTQISIGNNGKSISIEATNMVNHLFAPVIGINSSQINGTTKAIIGPIASTGKGIRPFAVEVFEFSYGDIVTLKQGAGDSYNGNFGVVALGGTGSSIYRSNALYGYKGSLKVGDFIKTETGNMAGATNEIKNYINSEVSTFKEFKRDSIRIWTLPLVNTLELNGRGEVQVMGFGQFYVESVDNKSGKIEITGRFVRYVTTGTIDVTLKDTGSYGAKLSR